MGSGKVSVLTAPGRSEAADKLLESRGSWECGGEVGEGPLLSSQSGPLGLAQRLPILSLATCHSSLSLSLFSANRGA